MRRCNIVDKSHLCFILHTWVRSGTLCENNVYETDQGRATSKISLTPPSRPTDLTQGDVVEAGDEKRNVAVREASSELDGEGRAWEKVAFNEHSKALAVNCHMESTFGANVTFGFKKVKTPLFHF